MCTVEKAKAFYLDRHGEPGGIRLSYAWAATCTLRCSAPYAYSGLCKIQIREVVSHAYQRKMDVQCAPCQLLTNLAVA